MCFWVSFGFYWCYVLVFVNGVFDLFVSSQNVSVCVSQVLI